MRLIGIGTAAFLMACSWGARGPAPTPATEIRFEADALAALSGEEQRQVRQVILKSADRVRELLPGLQDNATVSVRVIDRDTEFWGGVTGQAQAPGHVILNLSSRYPGGIPAAVRTALSNKVFHEFHHLAGAGQCRTTNSALG